MYNITMIAKERHNLLTVVVITSFLLLAAFGCEPVAEKQGLDGNFNSDSPGGEMNFSAVVKWIPLEGGFYGLVDKDGRRFLPINLAPEFRQDGLDVWVRGKPADVATIQMWGTPFEIYEIKIRLPSSQFQSSTLI
ncbi:MAG TPA: hypothetical protein ENI58_08150 [Nitrospirae bacterium]|nr:hypothetical protein [Nitrospirota bacterium]